MTSKNRNIATHSKQVCPDILRWLPHKWELFLGNYKIIKHFKKLVRKIRNLAETGSLIDLNRLCFLLYGLSRSGKTAMVKFLVRCLICDLLDAERLNPCDGTCKSCKQQPELAGLEGLWADIRANEAGKRLAVHFVTVDCTQIETPEQLRARLMTINSWDGIRILYFDEVHRLIRRGMDEMLLKAVEEKNAIWFFSTAKPEGLEDMFQNRLLRNYLRTDLAVL